MKRNMYIQTVFQFGLKWPNLGFQERSFEKLILPILNRKLLWLNVKRFQWVNWETENLPFEQIFWAIAQIHNKHHSERPFYDKSESCHCQSPISHPLHQSYIKITHLDDLYMTFINFSCPSLTRNKNLVMQCIHFCVGNWLLSECNAIHFINGCWNQIGQELSWRQKKAIRNIDAVILSDI